MYSTTNFHSESLFSCASFSCCKAHYPTGTSHEVLCISSGHATLCFGGEDNSQRVEADVETGDVIVVPADVGHRLLEDKDGGFEMVGSYPKGTNWDMCYGKEGEEDRVQSIGSLGWFDKDPLYGDEGPALKLRIIFGENLLFLYVRRT